MGTEQVKVCDVMGDYPRLKVEDVQKVTVHVAWITGGLDSEIDLCRRARERLVNGIERLLKPPAKREGKVDA